MIARYASLTLAAEAVGRTVSAISEAIKRGGKSAGFYWGYAEVEALAGEALAGEALA